MELHLARLTPSRPSDPSGKTLNATLPGSSAPSSLPDDFQVPVAVTCNGAFSHHFDLHTLLPGGTPDPRTDPIAYGTALYTALFPPGSPAHRTLARERERLLLVAADETLDAIAWEYLHGPHGFVVCDLPFVRGLPPPQRIPAPAGPGELHLIAVPSNPLHPRLAPLNIEGEWLRLCEIVQELEHAVTLERAWPPTSERVRALVLAAHQRPQVQPVVHFMGHGAQNDEGEAVLGFEQDNGTLALVSAREFTRRLRGRVFLVTLNACQSAAPETDETGFGNLAAALVREGVPYALGMRFPIVDEDALRLSRALYSELARGVPVEEAVWQMRLSLSSSERLWVIGVPALYTSLDAPAAGAATEPGEPKVGDGQKEALSGIIGVLPHVQGAFQGRRAELGQLGDWLTGSRRPRIMTLHGSGGQGKTALARAAVERFAHAWPGGVWATSLESLPTRETLLAELARFLGLDVEGAASADERERAVLRRLGQRRTLLLLDNAETLVQACREQGPQQAEAIRLAGQLQQFPGSTVSLLVTSRETLGWPGEEHLELGGLAPDEGAALVRQSAPQRRAEVEERLAQELSRRLDGHPFGLVLLGKAFNAISLPFAAFVADHEAFLRRAQDQYVGLEHRQRTLYANFAYSVQRLPDDLRRLLGKLWLFHAPFLPEVAVAIVDAQRAEQAAEERAERSPVKDQLYALWQRSLLSRWVASRSAHDEGMLVYQVQPVLRAYLEAYLAEANERETLLARFGTAYADLARFLQEELNRGGMAALLADVCRDDLERGLDQVRGLARGEYALNWGEVLYRLGEPVRGLKLAEEVLEAAEEQKAPQGQEGQEGQRRGLMMRAMNAMGVIYQATGRPQEALRLFEHALPLWREVGDRAGEATTFNNLGAVYAALGQQQQALTYYEQALPLTREVGDRAGEARTLNNLGFVYAALGQKQRALTYYEQALPLRREVSDRAGEATTLTNLGAVYAALGQQQQALTYYEQALPFTREVGNRAGEASTLNNLGFVYAALGQKQRALDYYEHALALIREVGDRAGEAATLNNLGLVYAALGQKQRALDYYEHTLPLTREVGDRAGEARTLINLGGVYADLGQKQQALTCYEQALPLFQEVGDRAGEATTLVHLAVALYEDAQHQQEALTQMEQALAILRATGLPQDAAGQTPEMIERILQSMRAGTFAAEPSGRSSTLPPEQIETIISNTIAVMTTMPERRAEWQTTIAGVLADARQGGPDWQIVVDFFTALLTILEGVSPSLPADHPYAPALTAIEQGIAQGGLAPDPADDEPEAGEVEELLTAFVQACVNALCSPNLQEKVTFIQQLAALQAQSDTPDEIQALLPALQLALVGGDLAHLGDSLSGSARQIWDVIVEGVQAERQADGQVIQQSDISSGISPEKPENE